MYNTDIIAGVAQSVEQLICNQPVAGSIPIASSNKIKPLGVCLRAFFMPGVTLGLRYKKAVNKKITSYTQENPH